MMKRILRLTAFLLGSTLLLSACGGKRIDDVNPGGFQHGRGDHRALHRAGEGGGDDDADDLLAGLLRRFKLGERNPG